MIPQNEPAKTTPPETQNFPLSVPPSLFTPQCSEKTPHVCSHPCVFSAVDSRGKVFLLENPLGRSLGRPLYPLCAKVILVKQNTEQQEKMISHLQLPPGKWPRGRQVSPIWASASPATGGGQSPKSPRKARVGSYTGGNHPRRQAQQRTPLLARKSPREELSG